MGKGGRERGSLCVGHIRGVEACGAKAAATLGEAPVSCKYGVDGTKMGA
jgi:hypothetical protein